jgi:2-C-methyl-D-erythritol 4-phosphate cytidylyltransferase/2-C-methyl-D-erythritol 2,4-cyclodiphosphate synthase
MPGAVAIIVAAGHASRLGGPVPKQFLDLAGRSMAERVVDALAVCGGIEGVVVAVPPDDVAGARGAALRARPGVLAVVAGGATRMESSLAGVEAASGAEFVLVHDAARPFVTPALAARVLAATRRHGAALPAIPVRETVKTDDGAGFVEGTVPRDPLRVAQTPQGARRDWLLAALRDAAASSREVTDEAQALELAGRKVAIVAGDPDNVKITTPEDWAGAVRRLDPGEIRIGHGYDVHRFGEGRTLMLGGVAFPGEVGLAGHSDADVVLHAAMDALLGAAGLPDIGHHFPPSDPRLAGAASAALAGRVAVLIRESGFAIVNVDLTILAEKPKIGARVGTMRTAIATAFSIEVSRVGLKATTLEGLGALGRAEGIACHAVALLRRERSAP